MRDWVKKKLQTTSYSPTDGQKYWQERLYKNIIFVLTAVALPGYIFGVYMAYKDGIFSIILIDTVVYFALVWLLIREPFRLKTKIYVLILLPLIIGISLILLVGPHGAGLSYLIGFVILSSILLGLKGAIVSLAVHLIFTVFFYAILHFNLFSNFIPPFYTPLGWVTISINSFVVCSITSIPLSILIDGLNRYILEHSTLEKTLKSKVIQLRKAKKEAENANLLKTKFLANMSHEVRTPLNVILGLSEIVKSGAYANTNERNQMLTTINQNGYYLLDIIDNILEISLIDSNQLSYHIKSTNITSLFTEIKQIYRINTKSKIKVLFEPSNINQEQTFFTDETRLKQVIINLINNAIKYTNEGEVRVSYNNYKEGIKIMVKDTGVGIHPDNLKVIFNRFVKIDGEKELIQGTGLGLAISRSIVEALGGKIWVQSKLHIGSSFYIYLPNQDKKPALVSNDTYAKQ